MKKDYIANEVYLEDIYDIINSNLSDEEKANELEKFHYYEISEALTTFSSEYRQIFYKLMSLKDLTRVFEYVDPTSVIEYIDELEFDDKKYVLNEMAFDDLLDIILTIDDEEKSNLYLSFLDNKERIKVKKVLKYDDDQVASIINTEYVSLDKNMTVKQSIDKLVLEARKTEYIDDIYVLEDGKLVGVISLRELISNGDSPKEIINNIMIDNVVSLNIETKKEEAINIFRAYDFLMMPVVNDDNLLLGVVTFDDITEAIDEKTEYEISKLAGISEVKIDIDKETTKSSIKKRLPWLILLLVIDIITATIITSFEDTLNKLPILAIFMPMILSMAGNSGTQSLAVIISFFGKEKDNDKQIIKRHIFKEAAVGFVNGLIIGVLLFGVVFIMRLIQGDHVNDILPFAFIISLSIFSALVLATIAGTIIPIVFKMLKIDPAVASGPLITTVNDIVSLTVYFTLATTFIANLL